MRHAAHLTGPHGEERTSYLGQEAMRHYCPSRGKKGSLLDQ